MKDPILFSAYFSVDPNVLEVAGYIDSFVNVDTPLFIDPPLLEKSNNPYVNRDGWQLLCERFTTVIRLLDISQRRGDSAWKDAARQLDLSEADYTGLGHGSSRRGGSSRPSSITDQILSTTKEIITLGLKDPGIISVMTFLEEGVGPDTISDYASNCILPALAAATQQFCAEHGVKTEALQALKGIQLPVFRDTDDAVHPIVLVPTDIVRDLPVASNWDDIERVVAENGRIRGRVNQILGGLTRATVTERKAAVRQAALESADALASFIASIREIARPYNPNEDVLGYYRFREVLRDPTLAAQLITSLNLDSSDPGGAKQIVIQTIEHFKHHVENGNLWELLWADNAPKLERASQLIYYAIADCFCAANNLDVSPEANMGGGPVDFKFSNGYSTRVLVEVKRSTGSVVHGYEKQLEVYKKAAKTDEAIFMVIDYGDGDAKIGRIQQIRSERAEKGERVSDIIIVDARKKESASKRH